MTRPNYTLTIPGQTRVEQGHWTPPNGPLDVVVNNYDIPADALYSEETVSGVSRRKPKGWIPPTGYTLFHKQYRRAVGSCRSYDASEPRNYVVYSGVVGSLAFNSLGHFNTLCVESYQPAGLDTRSLIAARNNLKQQKVNLGNAFGERKQLAHQLGDTASRMARSVRALRRGDWRRALQALGLSAKRGKPRGSNWTDHWLALQYGWKPLLADLHGAADALSKQPKSHWLVTAKGSVSQKDLFTATWTGYATGYGTARIESSAFTRIDALPQNDAIMSLTSLGITNPLEVAWEVTPFSFVVDWVYPIGDWLNSLDALLGYSTAYSTTSVFQRMKWHGSGGYANNAGTVYDCQYEESKTIVRLSRSASSGVPLPKMPPIKDGRSLGHMANGLALLAQAFGRSPRPLKG